MENNTPKLVCRKCQGPHLTIKCGKEGKSVIESKIIEIDKQVRESKTDEHSKPYERRDREGGEKSESRFRDKPESRFRDKPDSRFRDKPDSRFRDKPDSSFRDKEFRPEFRSERRPLHKVKMSNLPIDMTEEELQELLYDWGHVGRMRLLNYETNSTAYIEFKDKEPADYIVQALNKTPFEHIMLDVERLFD